jgi:tetratricopeptide (TPR) repeat protein
LELQRAPEALASFDLAVASNADFMPAHLHRGNALRALKRLSESLASYDRALALAPDYPEVLNNRGVVLFELGRVEEALACYDVACQRQPDYVDALCSRGAALQELGRHQEALESYDAALALRPGDPLIAFNKAHLTLLLGNFAEGWTLHEARWQAATVRPQFPRRQPLWLGEEDVAGKTVLLQAEQGFGDVVQFCRFASEVAKLGATVVVEVQREVFRLVSTLRGVSVVARGDTLPRFDYACPMMSLPYALKTTLATIPANVPYLHADPLLAAQWRQKLGEKTRRR